MKTAVLLAALLAATIIDPNAAFKSGDFDQAKQGYSAALKANPANADALAGMATVELYENNLSQSKLDAQAALKLDPASDRAKRVMRTISVRTGEPGAFQIKQTGDAILPFIVSNPLPVVRMKLNGADANVLIDTGAPNFVIRKDFALAHNMKITAAGQGVFAGGRTAQVSTTTLDTVSAGPLTVDAVPSDVLPVPPVGPGMTVDAVVGTAFFTHFLATIDYPRSRLVLQPAGTPAQTVAAAADVPMWLVGDHFIFTKGRINNGAPVLLNVDSGGGGMGLQLTKPALDAAHISPDVAHAQSFNGGGGATRAASFTADVAIGGASQNRLPGLYFIDGDQYGIFPFTVAGTVSHEFLKHYAVTFDFTNMRMILQ